MEGLSRKQVKLWRLKMRSGLGTAVGAVFVIIGYLGLLEHDHTYFEIMILLLLAFLNNGRIEVEMMFIRLDYKNKWKELTIIIETHIILFLLGFCIMELWLPGNFNSVILHLAFLMGFVPYSVDFWVANSNTTYETLGDIEMGTIENNEQSHESPTEGEDNWI
ncbi:unnamed protein product [Caenorhabditis brenneri]